MSQQVKQAPEKRAQDGSCQVGAKWDSIHTPLNELRLTKKFHHLLEDLIDIHPV